MFAHARACNESRCDAPLSLKQTCRVRLSPGRMPSIHMNVRTTVFETLVREVLGPRGGARETLALGDDPRDEYVTGVL